MVDQRLVNYIKKELAAGYKPDAVRTYLVNYGYNPANVDEAMKAATKPAPAAVARKIPILPIAGGVLAVVFIIVIILIFFTGEKEVEVVEIAADKLDVKISIAGTNARQGDTIQFTIILNSLDGKSHDAGLTYEVVNNNNLIISQKEDFASISQKTVEQKTIDLPSDIEVGSYNLVATARFDEEQVESSVRFNVLASGAEVTPEEEAVELVEIECPPCDDDDLCTEDKCSAATNYECVYFAITPCCGNLRCEDYEAYENCPTDCAPRIPITAELVTLSEITENARDYALTNLGQAENYCQGLLNANQQDSCFYVVSQTSDLSRYCGNIISELKRDNCYSEYALEGDFTVCDQMTNKYMKESCFELEEASKTTQLR